MDNDDFNKAAAKSSTKAEPCASDYLDMLDDEHLTDEQAQQVLETLFDIMQSFVLLGYGMEPVSKLIEEFQFRASASSDLIECKKIKEVTHE